MADLCDAHRTQLTRYALFLKGKRDRHIGDRYAEKEEFKSDRLSDDSAIYSQGDVESLLDQYHEQLMGQVREELEKTANLSGAYIAHLMSQAEQIGVELVTDDISIVEDETRHRQVAALAALSAAPPPVPKPKATLQQLGRTASAATADPALFQQMQELNDQNAQLTERYQHMQGELTVLMKERSALAAENEQVKAQLSNLLQDMHAQGGEVAGHATQIEAQLQYAQASLMEKQAEVEAMQMDLNSRLGDSSQFRDLKALLKKKSDQVKELKQYLLAHGIQPPGDAEECVELEADD